MKRSGEALRFSCADRLRFRCQREDGGLRVDFADNGTAFDPSQAPHEAESFDAMSEGGMGWARSSRV